MNIDWRHEGSAPASAGPDAFYQSREFHDLGRARELLGGALAHRMAVTSCEIFNVWHLPRKSLHVIYTLEDAAGVRATATVRFLRQGESRAWYARACAEAREPRSIVHVPAWDAVAYLFPEDPTLPALASMVDPMAVTARLARFVPMPLDPHGFAPTVLAYLPERRCAVAAGWRPRGPAFIGKLQESAAARHRAMQDLWNLPRRRFRMAEPIDCDAAAGIRWERFVPGRRIDQLIEDIGLESALQELLAGLAQLHQTPIARLRRHGAREILGRLQRKVLPRVRDSLGALGAPCDEFAARLGRYADDLPERAFGTVHGDFHTANILIAPEGPVLVDLDDLACGDPALDLALLGSRLLLIGLCEPGGAASLAAVVERLPHTYASVGGAAIPPEVFAWYMAAMLVGRQIKTCIRHLAPSLETLSRTLLDLADGALARRRFSADLLAHA
jgi:hypothetical protein